MPLLNDVGKLALETMANYVGLRGYLNIRWKEAWQDPLVFNNEINFWETLFENDYGEFLFVNKGRPIYLKHFRLSTWVPFIPGMFYKRSTIDGYRFSGRVLRHDKGEIILNMSSKTEFVMNGFANVRYERVEIDNESYLLLNAFTTSNSALGIPVLVRDRDLDLHNLRRIAKKLNL